MPAVVMVDERNGGDGDGDGDGDGVEYVCDGIGV